jgi:hypothetical protein
VYGYFVHTQSTRYNTTGRYMKLHMYTLLDRNYI